MMVKFLDFKSLRSYHIEGNVAFFFTTAVASLIIPESDLFVSDLKNNTCFHG